MDRNDLTPEQQQKLHNGCGYELARLVSTVLLTMIFLYAVPLLGGLAKSVHNMFAIFGMAMTANFIVHMWIYPDSPLEDLREELRKNNDLS